MCKKFMISLGLMMVMGLCAEVYAHSTIYTDDLGRMHFLGKDPGAKTLIKLEDYSNPAQKDVTGDVTNATYKSEQAVDKAEKKVNAKKKKAKTEKKRSQAETTNRNQKEFKQIW